VAAAALLLLGGVSCGEAPFLASPDATLTLFANPESIDADGGVSVISALLTEPNGNGVPNGTVVQFFTTLGSIEPEGKTRDGVARVNLVADSRSGTAIVTAQSGLASGSSGGEGGTGVPSVEVMIGNSKRMVLTADPQRLTSPGESRITANVFDWNGNPIANTPVVFSLVADKALRDTLQSGSVPQYTDANGRAFDVLSARGSTGSQRTTTVKAETFNGLSETVDVVVD
jgi:adhesin/invasin